MLDRISWPREVERRFFARKCEEVPSPAYEIDSEALTERLARIDDFERELVGDDALVRLLRSQVESHRLGTRMLLAAGTPIFYELSCKAYGGATTTSFDSDTTNLNFADHLLSRIGRVEPVSGDESSFRYSAGGLAAYIQDKLARRNGAPEARSLYLHEVETHVGSKRLPAATSAIPAKRRTMRNEDARGPRRLCGALYHMH